MKAFSLLETMRNICHMTKKNTRMLRTNFTDTFLEHTLGRSLYISTEKRKLQCSSFTWDLFLFYASITQKSL